MELAGNVAVQVLVIFILMGVGFALKKAKVLTKEGISQMSTILLSIVTPCVLIDAYQKKVFNTSLLKELGFSALLALAVQVIAIILATLLFKKDVNGHFRISICTTAYSNCGFMAIPLLSATMGENGVFFGSAYLIVFSVLVWTHGVYKISGDRNQISFKNILRNPGIIGTVVALVLFFAKIKLPAILSSPISLIAGLNTPLSMMILGTYLCSINIKKVLICKEIIFCNLMRLIIIPVIAVLLATLIKINPDVIKSTLIPAACPAAAVTTIFATKYKKDAVFATEIVASSTLLSVITIPLIIMLASFLGI